MFVNDIIIADLHQANGKICARYATKHKLCSDTWNFPPNTWRYNNVVITSKRRHFDVNTSKWRHFDVITTSLLRNVSAGLDFSYNIVLSQAGIGCGPYRSKFSEWIWSIQGCEYVTMRKTGRNHAMLASYIFNHGTVQWGSIISQASGLSSIGYHPLKINYFPTQCYIIYRVHTSVILIWLSNFKYHKYLQFKCARY